MSVSAVWCCLYFCQQSQSFLESGINKYSRAPYWTAPLKITADGTLHGHLLSFCIAIILTKVAPLECWCFRVSNDISIAKEYLVPSLHGPVKIEVDAQLSLTVSKHSNQQIHKIMISSNVLLNRHLQ